MEADRVARIRTGRESDLEPSTQMAKRVYEQNAVHDRLLMPNESFEREYRAQLHRIMSGQDQGAVYVAECTKTHKLIGIIEGTVVEWPYLMLSRRGFISMLYVEPDWRRSKVGSRLTAAFISWCKRNSVDRVELNVLSWNTIAQNFWTSHGFEVVAQTRYQLTV